MIGHGFGTDIAFVDIIGAVFVTVKVELLGVEVFKTTGAGQTGGAMSFDVCDCVTVALILNLWIRLIL